MSYIMIRDRRVSHNDPCYIVAEIGINHNGSVEIAKKLIDAASAMGCQAVKFQKRTVPKVYTPEELAKPREVPADVIVSAIKRGVLSKEAIQRLTESNLQNTTNGDLKWALELTEKEYQEIDQYCKEKGIHWFASPWDEESVDFLAEFDIPAMKVASASLTDDSLLRRIRAVGKPIILSTGMSTLEQIDHAVEVLGKENLVILHCTSTYPSKPEELNLKGIQEFCKRYGVPIGYSGHEVGIPTTVAAVAMGAHMIERHITLDRAMWGSDQAASVEVRGFERMVREIRGVEAALGDGKKIVYESEKPIIQKLRRVK